MYVIVEAGGRQWKVEPGTRLAINRVATDVGAQHTLDRVLLAHDGQQLQLGRPYLRGAKVVCEVLGHARAAKTITYLFRRRTNWRKTIGHRQPLTQLVVKDILFPGRAKAEEAPAKARAAKPSTAKTGAAKPASKSAVAKRPAAKR